MAYDFTTLSPDDFENLAADLLSEDWGVTLESFKPGKDSGIDLRNSRVPTAEETTIVQCKRYAPHKFAELHRTIEKEKLKLDVIRPQRYVLVTSVALSPANKDTLISTLKPWCKSPADIYGPTELNSLLRKYSDIERAHFKLWIGSTAVLERLLHSRIFNVTQATVESIKAELSKIVVHDGFNRALEMLHQDHHVLIVGNPGIGKTTLARILLCHYMREQFEPLCVVSNIDDAWNLLHGSSAGARKMVVLYDDFLGRLRFDSERFGKNEELSLFEFLRKVRRSPNLRFIFTTREYILADAQRVHGAFDYHVSEILKCTLRLEDYTKAHRAKMLFNHLYFSDLPEPRLARLVEDRAYSKIVQHRHFNPRIVERISTYANSRAQTDEDYITFIQQEFDDPSRMWEHPFKYEISPTARVVLTTLWTFRGTAELEMLKSAVKRLHAKESIEDFAVLFGDALRQLDGNFILTNRFPSRWEKEADFIVVQYQNPSVEDFIDKLLRSEVDWIQRLTEGIVCFKQVQEFVSHFSGEHRLHADSAAFWRTLRKAAALSGHTPGGDLINYRVDNGPVHTVWDPGESSRTEQIPVLLQIESKVNVRDADFVKLQGCVLTTAGWLELMSGIDHDQTIAYGVTKLHKWVMKESGWSGEDLALSHSALREAVFRFIQDEDKVWTCTVHTLRLLAEAICIDGSTLTESEKSIFLGATKTVVTTIRNNADRSDDVRDEADELVSLSRIGGLALNTQIARLNDYADTLAERESERDSADPESPYLTEASCDEEFDVDALFAGLLDR